ncbi:MAG: hypothetical protein FWD33_03240 [Alphaproteobacteria bacterium]|nr:hypothetical protein [Alphaproteobacteria bacterium]
MKNIFSNSACRTAALVVLMVLLGAQKSKAVAQESGFRPALSVSANSNFIGENGFSVPGAAIGLGVDKEALPGVYGAELEWKLSPYEVFDDEKGVRGRHSLSAVGRFGIHLEKTGFGFRTGFKVGYAFGDNNGFIYGFSAEPTWRHDDGVEIFAGVESVLGNDNISDNVVKAGLRFIIR